MKVKITRARLFVLLGLVLLLGGCASAKLTRNVNQSFVFNQPPQTGLVVFSLLTTDNGYQANPQLFYRMVGEHKTRLHRIILEDYLRLPGSVGQTPYYGELKVLALRPGTYEWVGWEIYRGINTGVLNRQPFSYQFTVHPGQIVYLGRIHFQVYYEFYKMPMVRLNIENKAREDLKIFRNYLPRYARQKIVIHLFKPVKPFNGQTKWESGNDRHN